MSFLKSFLISSFVMFSFLQAEAAECTSIRDCQNEIEMHQRTLQSLLKKQVSRFHDIAKYDDGSAMFLTYDEAVQYCFDHGARLPTARELAQLSWSLGAKGIIEISKGRPDLSYVLINAVDRKGAKDAFYFSNQGYQQLQGSTYNWLFWSSSISAGRWMNPYFLDGKYGDISSLVPHDHRVSVRCISDK